MGTRHLSALFVSVVISFLGLVAEAVEPEVAAMSAEVAVEAVNVSVANPGAVGLASATTLAEIEPWIHPSMPDSVRNKLEVAFQLALGRVATSRQCANLFVQLGADPFETLKTGLYFPANAVRESSVCGRSFAQTNVGTAPTWICRRITSYSDEQIAMVIIHEALHHAGLPEKPYDKKAMTSGQINDMVCDACDL